MARRIRAAHAAGARRIEVVFDDGSVRVVDVAPLLRGPIFGDIAADDEAFGRMFVDPQLHTVCWPGEIDLAPEVFEKLPDVSNIA